MSWVNVIKKSQLPPKLEAGQPITNEYRQQMDAWARNFNNQIIGVLNRIGESQNSSWCRIDPASRQVTWSFRESKKTYDFEEFANELKACLRAVVYNQFPSNYAFRENDYLQDQERYVIDMMRNSTASLVFGRYLSK